MDKEIKNANGGNVTAKPLRLLIAEDSQNDADLIIRELKRGGFDPKWKRIETARDMEDSLDSETWDLIISDFKMPNFSGLDALGLLKKKNIDIPFIIASGTIGEEMAVTIMKAGANDYLMKDNLKRLPSAVERELRDAEVRKSSKITSEDLKIAASWLKIAQKASKSGFWNWDMKPEKLYWSEEFYELFGLPAEAEASFDTWKSILHPEDLEMAMENIKRSIKEKIPLENEYRIILSGGEIRWIGSKGDTFYDESGNPIRMSGICIDITVRKKIENTQLFLLQSGLVTSEGGFFKAIARYLSESLGMDYVCIDRLSGDCLSAQTLAVYNNCNFEDNVEYTLKDTPCGEVVGKVICCFPSGVTGKFPKDKVLNDMGAESYIGTTLRDSTGRPIGLIAVIGRKPIENTFMAESILKIVSIRVAGEMERMESDEKLIKSENLFRTLTRLTPVGIYLTDVVGHCIYANEKWLEMSGMTLDEALGDGWIKAIHPDDRDHVLSNWEKMVKANGKWNLEYRFLTDSGKITTILGLATELRDEKGNIDGYVGANIDISERKQMEGRIRQSEKMEAVGQLAGGIAHDFNNQLAGIMGYAEMLAARIDDKNLRDYAENIIRASKRSADLTRNLLSFARKGKYLEVPVNVHNIIEEVVTVLERSINKRIEIKRMLKATPATISGDPTQIQNALLNLAINARDAMPGGGELSFTTENVSIEKTPLKEHAHEVPTGRCLKLCVSDNGLGMDKEVIKHIFEPFFTTKGVGKGTGMGLASVYGTVKSHHGFINVLSEPGKGSTFFLYFPLFEDVIEVENKEADLKKQKKSANILVVDDEEMVRQLLSEIFKTLGHNVTTCKDGAEAVEIYKKSHKDTDIVVLDMEMPRLSGKDTFFAMRAINSNVKVLLASGFSIDGEAQGLIEAGAKGFVQKPFNISDLSRSLDDALR